MSASVLIEAVQAEGFGGCGVVAAAFGDVQAAGIFEGRGDGRADGGQVDGPAAGAAGSGVFAGGHVADVVVRLDLSSRLRWWDMIRGVAGEFGVDAGGPAAGTVDVGAEVCEFAGIGVDDPAVRVPVSCRPAMRPWCSHLRMVPVVTPSSAASSGSHHSCFLGAMGLPGAVLVAASPG